MAVNNDPPIQLQLNTPKADEISYINQNFRKLSDSLSPFMINDGSNNVLLIGKDSTDDYVVKIAKAGHDAYDAADSDLIFNSKQNVFKIVQSGTTTTPTYSIGGTSGIWTNWLASPLSITHNLGFVPGVIAYIQVPSVSQYILLPTTFQSIVGTGGTGVAFERVAVNVDSTKLYILDTTLVNGVVSSPTTNGGLNITYYLLQETAT